MLVTMSMKQKANLVWAVHVDLVCGITAIDLKSIIGVANVDLSKTYTLEILVNETKKTEELNNYLQFIENFTLEDKNEKKRNY